MKPTLQSVTPYKVMGITECLDALGWTYTESENRFDDISCLCDGNLTFSGFIGTERVECESCGKHMVDLFSPIRTGNSTATILYADEFSFDGDKHWVAVDGKGGIMATQGVEKGAEE